MNKTKNFNWTPANLVSYSGMILVLFAYYYFYIGDLQSGTIFYIAAALTDWLDGFVARNKFIQRITGRGVSRLGKLLDPIRDTMLGAIIFLLADINNITQVGPIIIAVIALLTFILFSQKINKIKGEVTTTKTGKVMQFSDCALITIWLIVMLFFPQQAHDTSVVVIFAMMVTAGLRFFSYSSKLGNMKIGLDS